VSEIFQIFNGFLFNPNLFIRDETEKYQQEAFGSLDLADLNPVRFKREASEPAEVDWNAAGHVTPVKDQGFIIPKSI
jgi:hypothetical protein